MVTLIGTKPGLFSDCQSDVSCVAANAGKQTRDASAQEGHPDKVQPGKPADAAILDGVTVPAPEQVTQAVQDFF